MVRFSRGDDTAFEEIVKTYQPRICRFLRGRILDADRAEDLTQEVFLRVHRARHRYRPTARLRTWLYTIANRLALNEIRAVRRRRRVFPTLFPSRRKGNPEADPTAGPLSLDDLPAATRSRGTASASARAQANELEETIGELLERLPVNQRTAIELFASERLTYAEIAGAMGVTVASVRSLIVRARGSLRVGLGPYLGEEPGPTGEAPRTMGEAPRTMGEAPRRTGEAPRTVGEEPGREEVEP